MRLAKIASVDSGLTASRCVTALPKRSRVARAIFASRIPVVSAVGHETDVTI
ncbi:exodeoxyribonuclease VII large subunit, partial [Escherichia sp. SS-MK2]